MTQTLTRIQALKKEKNALIFAHYYQTMDIQAVADVVGDSFELARRAQQADAPLLVLCGVRFMAESAKLLNPEKTVLLPVADAGCPMADMVTPVDVLNLRAKHKDAAVVCYVNSSASVKAVSDICCTSSSAVRIVRSLPQEEILFIPDKNLAAFVQSQVPEKRVIPFSGYCPIHENLKVSQVEEALRARPDAKFLAHPECQPAVCNLADFVGSTAEILRMVETAPPGSSFIIGTERGVVERLRETAPNQTAYALPMICPNMKKTTLSDLLFALETGQTEIFLDAETQAGATLALKRMVEAV